MRTIMKAITGSRLYGTNIETSDTDHKGIYIPSGRDIVLGRAPKTSDNSMSTKLSSGERNGAADVDIEMFTLQAYLTKMLPGGQTVAVEMLFIPKEQWAECTPEWEFIVKNREHLIHRGVAAFVGYCVTQANKYCVKGSRVGAAKAIVDYLGGLPGDQKLIDTDIVSFIEVTSNPEIALKDIKIESGMAPHLYVCGRYCPMHFKVKDALKIYEGVYRTYGKRAKDSLSNEGIDWKSLMHALRIAQECTELLSTGKITFPRPNAEQLREVRKGLLTYDAVQDMIEEELARLTHAQEVSTLPEGMDVDYWTAFVERQYVKEISMCYADSYPSAQSCSVNAYDPI